MKTVKLTEEQYSGLRKAEREIQAVSHVLEDILSMLITKKAELHSDFWETVEQIVGVKCNEGKKLRINWVSGVITCDDLQESDFTEVGE